MPPPFFLTLSPHCTPFLPFTTLMHNCTQRYIGHYFGSARANHHLQCVAQVDCDWTECCRKRHNSPQSAHSLPLPLLSDNLSAFPSLTHSLLLSRLPALVPAAAMRCSPACAMLCVCVSVCAPLAAGLRQLRRICAVAGDPGSAWQLQVKGWGGGKRLSTFLKVVFI